MEAAVTAPYIEVSPIDGRIGTVAAEGKEHVLDVRVVFQQSLSHFEELVPIFDLMWNLRQTQIVLKHLINNCLGVEAVALEDRAILVESLVSHSSLLANTLPLFLPVNHWLCNFPASLFDIYVIHLNIGFFIMLHWIAL